MSSRARKILDMAREGIYEVGDNGICNLISCAENSIVEPGFATLEDVVYPQPTHDLFDSAIQEFHQSVPALIDGIGQSGSTQCDTLQSNEEVNLVEGENENAAYDTSPSNENRVDLMEEEKDNAAYGMEEQTEELFQRKRAKRHNLDQSMWLKIRNQANREKGLAYKGKMKVGGKWKYDIPRNKKMLSNVCDCKITTKSSKIECRKLTQENREYIFNIFWNHMNWQERKIYIQSLVKIENLKRRRGATENNRKNYSLKYYLKVENKELRVCKKMFLNTMSMKESTVLNWTKSDKLEENEKRLNDKRKQSRSKMYGGRYEALNQFFDSLPKVESHYCRASSSKLYLEPMWASTNQLYGFYKHHHCPDRGDEPVSRTIFFKEFNKRNLSIYVPKKDLCDTCVAYDAKNLPEEEYDLHQVMKKEAREEKEKDKKSSASVFTMDLQKFDTPNYYKSIRPGRDTVVKIRALKYDPSGKIYYKLRHTDPWDQLNQRVKLSPPRPTQSLPNMYQERRKIKKEKYDHLQILKKTLLQDYHTFYDNLPYEEN
ncbi:unnamed protein product [Acanthoscelides obtectus]|uniref:Uncharacterized protein n=1 Tax=Acanthoscelides obtectus TaxID=200917 RepID=A0A9P0M002_ACAOB|nr:unnamed protein product [Acanthoscelides obtectus]CAK1668525.1 hypothetical protein AOBTE_LOCUS26460 [Acanthoscelides obtectus]